MIEAISSDGQQCKLLEHFKESTANIQAKAASIIKQQKHTTFMIGTKLLTANRISTTSANVSFSHVKRTSVLSSQSKLKLALNKKAQVDTFLTEKPKLPKTNYEDSSLDAEKISKFCRPRTAHELSHERANRLCNEKMEKCVGKYCNRLDAKFGRKVWRPKLPKIKTKKVRMAQLVSIVLYPVSDNVASTEDLGISRKVPYENGWQFAETKCLEWTKKCKKYFKSSPGQWCNLN